jgi:hypothetical protein
MFIRPIAAVLLAVATVSGAAAAADAPAVTTLAVSDAATLQAGEHAPVSVGGVRAIRKGKPIPAGYELIGQSVQTTPGGPTVGAALTLRCPASKRLRGLAVVGAIGFTATDRDYPGKRQTLVATYPSTPNAGPSQGTVYAACR